MKDGLSCYVFETEEEAISALEYINTNDIFPIIGVNAKTKTPEPENQQTIKWADVKRRDDGKYFFQNGFKRTSHFIRHGFHMVNVGIEIDQSDIGVGPFDLNSEYESGVLVKFEHDGAATAPACGISDSDLGHVTLADQPGNYIGNGCF